MVGWVWVLLKGVGCLGPAFRASAGGGPGNICSSSMVGEGLGVVKGGVAGGPGGGGRFANRPYGRERVAWGKGFEGVWWLKGGPSPCPLPWGEGKMPRPAPRTAPREGWIPAFAGMTGDGRIVEQRFDG